MADGGQLRSADVAHALGELIGGGEDLLALLVEQQVVIAEMRTADVPMEILGLEVEREGVRQQPVERLRELADGVGRQVGRGIEGVLALRARSTRSDFLPRQASEEFG